MWRHRTTCNHCPWKSRWQRDRDRCETEILAHLQKAHGASAPTSPRDYEIVAERQCDYCLEPYVDHCTKCDHDFCRLHEGDIDGLCGACI